MPGPDHKTKVLCEDESCTYNVDGKCSCGTITIGCSNYNNCCESYEEKEDEE